MQSEKKKLSLSSELPIRALPELRMKASVQDSVVRMKASVQDSVVRYIQRKKLKKNNVEIKLGALNYIELT